MADEPRTPKTRNQVDEPPAGFYEMAFRFATCPCSRRTAIEEERLGSYCVSCWDAIKTDRQCAVCHAPVEQTRLYVLAVDRQALCKRCFGRPLRSTESPGGAKVDPDAETRKRDLLDQLRSLGRLLIAGVALFQAAPERC